MIKFVGSFENVCDLPNTQFREYAFIGRSNVGKSSLINAVVRESVARTSNTPGRTQSLNLFNVNDKIMLVDLPGYGYARTSKIRCEHWLRRLEKYLITRRQLSRLFILIDSRVGLKESDLDIMSFCDKNGILYQMVYTKSDKKTREQSKYVLDVKEHSAMFPEVLTTSAENKTGLESLRILFGIK